jgi:hypothetical protein
MDGEFLLKVSGRTYKKNRVLNKEREMYIDGREFFRDMLTGI